MISRINSALVKHLAPIANSSQTKLNADPNKDYSSAKKKKPSGSQEQSKTSTSTPQQESKPTQNPQLKLVVGQTPPQTPISDFSTNIVNTRMNNPFEQLKSYRKKSVMTYEETNKSSKKRGKIRRGTVFDESA